MRRLAFSVASFAAAASAVAARSLAALPLLRGERRLCFLCSAPARSGVIGTASDADLRHRPSLLSAPARPRPRPSPLLRAVADLGTAYEWLAEQRDGDAGGPVASIDWVDIAELGKTDVGKSDDGDATATAAAGDGEESSLLRVPLYPLPAAYLPSDAIQTLNNVEPRNMKMAQDLALALAADSDEKGAMWNGRFCVVLRAADTGRIASVGTLMRVVDVEEHRAHYDQSLMRIGVKCKAEGLVQIEGVDNPEVWTAESRLRRTDEYLIAGVRELGIGASGKDGGDCDDVVADLAERLCSDYGAVRSMYVEREGVATRELPPFAVDAVRNIPELTVDDFSADSGAFWDAAEAWQVLCNTVREARRVDVQSTINEIMIAAASAKGGMLCLPIHREDLSSEVQMQIKRLEEDAAQDFVALGMDPCLDFQALISCPDHVGRLKHLHRMVSRERSRLEAKEQLRAVFSERDESLSNADEMAGFE